MEEQIAEQIASVEESLTNVDEVFGNLNTLDYDEVVRKMSSLDRAKYDLTNLYAINSLFWMYVRSFGEDPNNLSIKEELDRIKQQMLRVKQITEKANMPRVDKEAAQRIIKHELWDPKNSAKQKQTVAAEEEDWDNPPSNVKHEPMETDNQAAESSRGKKRKIPKDDHETNKKA